MEWHAFATIAQPDEKGFSLVVSNAGDWTKRKIKTAPTKLWVKGVPACGVLCISTLFRSMVLVATGSGIGPCLPILLAAKKTGINLRYFWSTPHPEETFGKEILDAVLAADPRALIHNTKTMGRPDMLGITWRLLMESGAEAVAIISNKRLTQKVVYGMETRGVPACGAIFDSYIHTSGNLLIIVLETGVARRWNLCGRALSFSSFKYPVLVPYPFYRFGVGIPIITQLSAYQGYVSQRRGLHEPDFPVSPIRSYAEGQL